MFFGGMTIGNLTRDPEIKTSKKGNDYVVAGVAINTGWGDNEEVMYARLTALEGYPINVLKAAKKGSMIAFMGPTTIKAYLNKNGEPMPSIDIVVREISFVNSGRRNNDDGFAGAGASRGSTFADDSFDGDVPF